MQLVDIADNRLPPGAIVTRVRVSTTVELRVARWEGPADACRGTVAVLPGRSEFIEKYAEVVADLLGRAFAVLVIDWRGQGGSTRLLADPRRGHVRDFADYRSDLAAVVSQVLLPCCPKPHFALAHSMGGAIALDHACAGPSPFQRYVLSAPMLELYGLRMPGGTRQLVAALSRLGGRHAYIPGGSGRSWMTQAFEGNGLTSDRDRYAAFQAIAKAAPDLLIGAPTIGWVHAAFRVMDHLASSQALERLATPVLAIGCGADRVVDTRATERLMRRLKVGQAIVVRHALHEILMEQESYRKQFWTAFDRFIPGSAMANG